MNIEYNDFLASLTEKDMDDIIFRILHKVEELEAGEVASNE